jgi:5'-phosphate synthase pdxT subunit
VKIGVLALQGAFIEHIQILRRLGVEAVEVRLPEQLEGLDGLIIPGGESTTIGKLATLYGLVEPLRAFAEEKPVWGTCAGMIFMAKDVGREQPLLGLMDITVERNAFGRQVDSFEVGLEAPDLPGGRNGGAPFPAIFIRGPRLASADEEKGVEVLARLADGTAVAARQGHWLVTSFHPELSDDPRFHQYFLQMIVEEAATDRK